MHSALCTSDNLSLVKFLLSQDMCLPMLLSKFECYDRGILKPLHQPLHLAQTLVVLAQVYCTRLSPFVAIDYPTSVFDNQRVDVKYVC